MKVVITGATGFIGKALVQRLRDEGGHTVTVIGRDPARARATLGGGDSLTAFAWEDREGWRPAVHEADAVFHLAGEPVAGPRWTPEYKEKILQSRIETTRAIVDAAPQGVLVSASAVGYYGDRGDRVVTEADAPGDDFLARVCVAWEAEARRALSVGTPRVVPVRIGIVLGPDGGPLGVMLPPFRKGMGGPLGSGKQYVPWIHRDDALGILLWAATQETVRETVNVVAPNPVTSAQLAAALGRALHKPAVLPMPAFALKAIIGEMAYALLYSQRVVPEVAQRLGYQFRFPDIDSALGDILGGNGAP